jgi:AbrB family looped-hinge helix DNA binding protein
MSLMRGTARLDARGRLVLPAELRRRLGLHAGDEVRISEETDGALRVETRRAAAQALIGLAGTAEESAVDELTAERNRETELEEREARRFRSARGVRRRN